MPDATPNASTSRPAGLFATTLWTTVLKAGSAETTQSRAALERLCRAYWYPLYPHARQRGSSPHNAEDAVQGFFADLIERQGQHFSAWIWWTGRRCRSWCASPISAWPGRGKLMAITKLLRQQGANE